MPTSGTRPRVVEWHLREACDWYWMPWLSQEVTPCFGRNSGATRMHTKPPLWACIAVRHTHIDCCIAYIDIATTCPMHRLLTLVLAFVLSSSVVQLVALNVKTSVKSRYMEHVVAILVQTLKQLI